MQNVTVVQLKKCSVERSKTDWAGVAYSRPFSEVVMRYWISFAEWYAMTPEQRQTFIDQTGGKFVLDLSNPSFPQREFQADKDEYIEEMSLGGQTYTEQ